MLDDTLKQRLDSQRAMTTVTIRIPIDVVDSLKRIAPLKGFQGYQTLLKSYVSQGLRSDEARFPVDNRRPLIEALKARGVAPDIIDKAVRDIEQTD